MIQNFLAEYYLWTKSLHVMSVIAWMAGLFYLPRLFVYHAERVTGPGELAETLQLMQHKLLKVIVNPAGVATWAFGLALVLTPGVVDWSAFWPWGKAALVIGMTVYHHALVRWERSFARGENLRPGRFYRAMNEVPTLLMIGIVVFVIVKPY